MENAEKQRFDTYVFMGVWELNMHHYILKNNSIWEAL